MKARLADGYGEDQAVGEDVVLGEGVRLSHFVNLYGCRFASRDVRPYMIVAGDPAEGIGEVTGRDSFRP